MKDLPGGPIGSKGAKPIVGTTRMDRGSSLDPNDPLVDWESFFSAVTNAGAALVGLVFVGVSIHLSRHELDRATWTLATMAIVNLLHPVLASLGMLAPVSLEVRGAGLLVLATAGFGGAIATERIRRRSRTGRAGLLAAYRYVIPLVAVTALTGGAIMLLLDEPDGAYAVALFIGLMVIVGAQNAWDLLLGTQAGLMPPENGEVSSASRSPWTKRAFQPSKSRPQTRRL